MIEVLVVRSLLFRGERFEAGLVMRVEPLDAAALVDSRRAALVHHTDRATVDAALVADTQRVLRRMPEVRAKDGIFPR